MRTYMRCLVASNPGCTQLTFDLLSAKMFRNSETARRRAEIALILAFWGV